MDKPHRNTIHCEDAEILQHHAGAAGQHTLRLHAPECARRATPGSFVHVRCNRAIPMRRPLSIMRADAAGGWIEVLFKVVGIGLSALAGCQPGERVNILGPIGQGFRPDASRPLSILIGGGVGIPPLLFLAEALHADTAALWQPVAFLGSELPFPFHLRPSRVPLPGTPTAAAGATLALLDAWDIPAQLASHAGLEGCHDGYVTDLARRFLNGIDTARLAQAAVYACGPTAMLREVRRLAGDFALPSQLCLEEFMACAVGGCAGCALPVVIDGQRRMRRVCVDGPVFDGASVLHPAA